MEQYIVNKDIPLIWLAAPDFPDGVLEAHQQLHGMVTDMENRRFFGISWFNEKRQVVYMAAVEELHSGEAEQLKCGSFTIAKGVYMAVMIRNFRDDIPKIGKTFEQLLVHPDIDPNAVCIEMYTNMDDVLCMVKLLSNHQ